jgi:hypothetical protein
MQASFRITLQTARLSGSPVNDVHLGPGFMRIITALPDNNARFMAALRELLHSG